MVDSMKTLDPRFVPQVFRYRDEDNSARFALVFRKGRVLYHAIVSLEAEIKLATVPSLRGFAPLDYPARQAASFWLNHDHRPITKRARAVLKGLVARKPKGLDSSAGNG